VGDTGLERSGEDRHHEPWIDGVQDVADPLRATELRDRCRIGRVDRRRRVPAGALVVPFHDAAAAIRVAIGEHDALVEVTASSDRREGCADAARPNDKDPHGSLRSFRSVAARWMVARVYRETLGRHPAVLVVVRAIALLDPSSAQPSQGVGPRGRFRGRRPFLEETLRYELLEDHARAGTVLPEGGRAGEEGL